MKIHYILPLIAIALAPIHAPCAFAETPVPPSTEAPSSVEVPRELPKIDVRALRLLASFANQYEHLGYYSGIVDFHVSGPDISPLSKRFQIAYSNKNQGVISEFEETGARRWVTDGRQTLAFDSRRPRQYKVQPFNASGFEVVARDEFFLGAGFQGVLSDFLRGRIGRVLVDPDLRSISIVPITDYLITYIKITSESADKSKSSTILIGVVPTGFKSGAFDGYILHKATLRQYDGGKPGLIWEENYSRTVLSPDAPPGFEKMISTAPPQGYNRVTDFGSAPSMSLPVSYEAIPKLTVALKKIPMATTLRSVK